MSLLKNYPELKDKLTKEEHIEDNLRKLSEYLHNKNKKLYALEEKHLKLIVEIGKLRVRIEHGNEDNIDELVFKKRKLEEEDLKLLEDEREIEKKNYDFGEKISGLLKRERKIDAAILEEVE